MLRWLTDASLAESIAGDLAEERQRRAVASAPAATLWFWHASFRIATFFAVRRLFEIVGDFKGSIGQFGGWRQDARHAARSLRRAPWYAATTVAVIALSTALATTVFAIVDGVLFKPLSYPDAGALHALRGAYAALPSRTFIDLSMPDIRAWSAAIPGMRVTVMGASTAVTVADNDYLRAAEVDRQFFDVLGVRPILGGFTDADFETTSKIKPAILAYDVWQSRYGGASEILGRALVDERGEGARIVGILPRGFVYPHPSGSVAPGALLPMKAPQGKLASEATIRGFQLVARVPAGWTTAALESRLALATRDVAGQFPSPPAPAGSPEDLVTAGPFDRVRVEPLRDVLAAPIHTFAAASFTVAAGLLLLGALNLAGLAAGRTLDRHRELTLRVALGGGTATMLRLLAAEHAIVVLTGTMLGLGLATVLLRYSLTLLPVGLLLLKAPAIDVRVVVFGVLAGLGAVAIVTIWSMRAIQIRELRPALASTSGSTARTRSIGRAAMVATQVAVALVMALGGALLSASLVRVWQESPGFSFDHTARIRINTPSAFPLDEQNQLVDLLGRLPGVRAVGGLDEPFFERAITGSMFAKPVGALQTGRVEHLSVTSGFFPAIGLSAIEGRLPNHEEFDLGRPVVVVSRRVAAAYWPGHSALGQPLVRQGRTFEVIGVVPDIRHASLDRESEGEIYAANAIQPNPDLLSLLVRFDDDADERLPRVVAELSARFPRVKIVRAELLSRALGTSVQLRRFQAWLFSAFGGAALVIVGVGMLGSIAMSVARRTREVGVRMALGATSGNVTGLIIGEQVRVLLTGLVAGGLLSAWLVRFVGEYLYKMTTYDWMAWTSAIALLVMVTLAAALIPALRASRVDPIQALRVD